MWVPLGNSSMKKKSNEEEPEAFQTGLREQSGGKSCLGPEDAKEEKISGGPGSKQYSRWVLS